MSRSCYCLADLRENGPNHYGELDFPPVLKYYEPCGDPLAMEVAQLLRGNQTIKQVTFKGVEIGDRGASAFAELLKIERSITSWSTSLRIYMELLANLLSSTTKSKRKNITF